MPAWVYNTGCMAPRKITSGSFDHGPLRKILNKQERRANISAAGRERVTAALKAGVERETKRFNLQYGVGAAHAEALGKFPTSKKYEGRFDPKLKLKPKELKVVEESLGVFFKTKKVEPKEAPHASITSSPSVSSKTMSDRSISPKNDEGSDKKSVP